MPSVLKCPHCAHRYKLPVEYQGRTVRCKSCEQRFRAPILDAADTASSVFKVPRRLNWPARDEAGVATMPSADEVSGDRSVNPANAGRHRAALALAIAGMILCLVLVYLIETSPWVIGHPSRSTLLAGAAGVLFLGSLATAAFAGRRLMRIARDHRDIAPAEPADAWQSVFTQISSGAAPLAPVGST
jgi:hypothetical protein